MRATAIKPTSAAAVLALLGVYLLSANVCKATLSFIGNGYVILNPNSSGDTYYKVDSYNTSGNPPFTGNLFSIQTGQSLLLGGEIQTYPSEYGVTVTMYYAIDQNSSFSSINLNYFQTQNNNDWWHNVDAVNIDNGLSNGSHTLYVWFSATDGSSTVYDNNGGINYSATFSVVPEPITRAVIIWGALMVAGAAARWSWLRCRPMA